ncbi:reverse transcriptase domain-containing protein [Artemisia annua]|uniref:Reverse transcriptase domain-containing protein n=1 Tax=Artemisia annua TaxID=35608 RepID=A0A2U1QPI0_ARTAN|nr:reverse transcriptase domain-containing protein [Artemisia annua]
MSQLRPLNDSNLRQATGTSGPEERDPEPRTTFTRVFDRIPVTTNPTGETTLDAFTTPAQTVPETYPSGPPPAPERPQEPNPGANASALEGLMPNLPPGEFVTRNFESLAAYMREEARRRSNRDIQARLSFDSDRETYSPPHRRPRARRTPVFNRIGERVDDSAPRDKPYPSGSEASGRRRSVHDRIGGRPIREKSREQQLSPGGDPSVTNSSNARHNRRKRRTPPPTDSEDDRPNNRRKRGPSVTDSSDNEEKETGHWKSRRRHRTRGSEDISRPWRRDKIDAFTRRISDFSEDRRRRLPTNVKTYDGTGDPDDHLKVFESAAAIENWPQPVWCHMFNSTLVGNAHTWFSKLPRRSIDGYKTLRKAFRLNFTQRKKCAKNPVDLARIKQRQGETDSAFMERFKDECMQFKACPEVLKISAFMNGASNPELIKKLHDGVPTTLDEVMKRTRSFIQGETAAADSKKGEIFAAEGANFPKPPAMRTPEDKRTGNGYCDYHGQKGHTTNKCVQLRQLIDKMVKEGRLDHLVKNIKDGKDRGRTEGKKDNPKDKQGTIFMIHSWDRSTKQKVTQRFSRGNKISFPPLTAENAIAEPLVIEIQAGGHNIHRMYIDGGASADIMYEHCFNKLQPDIKQQLTPATMSLTRFAGEKIWPIGQLRLPVTLGDNEHSTTTWVNFMVIRSHSLYNGIIGRSGISALRAVPSTAHGMLKFPVDGGIVTLYNNITPTGECNAVNNEAAPMPAQQTTKIPNIKVAIHPDYPEQQVSLGGSLSDKGKTAICALLQRNLDVFAWEPKHMTGVPRSISEHRLNIRQGYNPVRQKKRGQAPDRAKAVLEEVHKLKSDGSWRMCVDFTDLKKACPQDCYPLPEIDWKVESLCGYPFKCFMDAYKGYHQIQMAEEDEEKTAFHTSQGVFCYTKMPFGLKNAGATYQRLVDAAFEKQVGRNLEVYVDDLVIKSHSEEEIVRDIEETFSTLRKINMKLNPKKCTFGATEGMFLGYLIEPDGIKACPEKTDAVIQLSSPRTLKEAQSLNGKLAGLNRFLSKSADKSLPLFKTLKKCMKKGDFRWTTEAEEAFTQLKQTIASLPKLVAPQPGEELIVYLSATHGAISAVLLTDRNSVQTPVYFVSKALNKTEINYTAMEKLVLALVFTAKRLRRYFQAHPIAVITDQPIKQVISKPEASGRLRKWSVLLGEYNISYRPRTAIKGQILADFIVEKPEEESAPHTTEVTLEKPWILFTDGSSCTDGSGAGLICPTFEFTATNNEAEYEALLAGLHIANRMGVRNLEANVDSRLVANHVLGEYVAKEENMIQYLAKAKSLIQNFDRFTIKQVPRGENKKADALSKIASTSFAHLSKQVLVEILKDKSISEMEVTTKFISEGNLPQDQKEARRIRRLAQRFEFRDGVLYRRSFLQPWLRCVGPLQANYVLREIHEGSCSMHSGPRSVVARALRSGYYWPTMHHDARELIKKCHDCQIHRPIPRRPQQELSPITAPWPFYKWGIDIAGPFPAAAGGLKFLIVAVDYFTKWIEAKA